MRMIIKKMSFQLTSDLHLEFDTSMPVVERKADNLILAGDIGYPTHERFVIFMKTMCQQFDKVFYIAGNHEYYCGLPKSKVDTLLDELSKEIGFVYLNDSVYNFNDTLTIIGSTLWTKATPQNTFILETYINDYRKIILDDGNRITPKDTGRWHEEAVAFLFKEFAKPGDKLVITHHLPSKELVHAKYQGHPATCAFASSLDYMFSGSGVKVWCAGHTHSPVIKMISNIQFYVNPYGYHGENKDANTSLTFII